MNKPEDINRWVASMRSDLQMLASPATRQVEYLIMIGVGDCADEMALNFDDDFKFLICRAARFSKKQIQAIQAVDAQLSKMSGEKRAHLWSFDALRSSAEWAQVRILAALALNLWPEGSPQGENIGENGSEDG